MIKSMTGFGRSEITEENRKITVEIKSVNHRYLDVNIKTAKKLGMFDSAIRNLIKEYASRGKIDVFISYEDLAKNTLLLKYNENIAKEYLAYFSKMEKDLGLKNDVTVMSLSKCPEVFMMEDENVDEDELWKFIERALREALTKFVNTRVVEGEHLRDDIIGKLQNVILGYVDVIEEKAPSIIEEYRNKLKEKIADLLDNHQIDETRLAQEVVIFSDKVCVDEETVRLRSHVEKMIAELSSDGDIGRKLDFIAQEMNRESNTILSKSSDLEIVNIGIGLKTEIEKVREQIQNIE